MRKIKMQGGEEFRLQDMATYIRVVSEAEYTPILPIPSIPGRNNKAITFSSMHYSGY